MTVVTPEGRGDEPITAWPQQQPGLAILLHGLTGNNAAWPAWTNLASLASRLNLVLALPDGARSFWIDQAYGLDYGTWVGQELPDLLRRTLRVSTARDDTFIGGLSMGGYGAFRAAFDYPQTYGAAFALSGVLDVGEPAFRGRHPDLYRIGFGDTKRPRPGDDLVARLETGKETGLASTRFFAVCGDRDRLLDQNRHFADAAKHAGLDIEYREGEGGHDFVFWNEWLPTALQFLAD